MNKILIYGCLPQCKNYIDSVKKVNLFYDCSFNPTNLKQYSALVLCGGGDILPTYYNIKTYTTCSNINFVRDMLELSIMHYFVVNRLPILGICKGMQIINVYFNGTVNNINFPLAHQSNSGNDIYHTIHPTQNSFIDKIYGKNIITNSNHHQKIDKLSKELLVSATSKLATIEGLEHKTLPIIGCQFHPERMNNKICANGIDIFLYFKQLINNNY